MGLPGPVAARIEGWKARLLDLSRANRLLHHRPRRASSVPLVEEDPREVLGWLAAGRKLTFLPRPEGASPPTPGAVAAPAATPARRAGDPRLQTDLPKDVLLQVLQRLFRDARSSIEDQGFNVLFLACGMLEYVLPGEREAWRAPLLLHPVALLRRGARADFSLEAFEDDVRVNPALTLKLAKELGIDLGLAPAGDEAPAYDAVRAAFARACEGREGWRVADELHLAPFSFARIGLYEDLVRHGDAIGARPIVATLATGVRHPELDAGPLPTPADVESAPEAEQACRILSADSSQEAALLAARRGQSFVLQGPPGTGKSQTIANAIADALAAGRTVLFVSEKMAALEVVQRRLAQAGLGDFCLELHSSKASKREVVASLASAWKHASEGAAVACGRPPELGEVRAYLQAYARALGQPVGRAGLPAHRVLGEAARLGMVPEVRFDLGALADPDGPTLQRVQAALREAAEVRRVVAPVGAHPWRGAGRTTLGVATLEEVRRALNLLLDALAEVARRGGALASLLGLAAPGAVEDLARLADLGEHLRDAPRPASALLVGRAWPGLTPRGEGLLARGLERARLRTALLERFAPSLLAVDAAAWLPRARPGGGPFGWFRRRGLLRDLRAHAQPGAEVALADVAAAARLRAETAALEADRDAIRSTFGDALDGLDGDWPALARQVAWVRRLLELWPADRDLDDAARAAVGTGRAPAVAAAEALRAALAALEARRATVVELLALADPSPLAGAWRRRALGELVAATEAMAGAMDALPDWTAWRRRREAAAALGLGGYLDAFDARDEDGRHLVNAWFRAYTRTQADRALAATEALAAFEGRAHEARVERYRDLDGKQMGLDAARVAVALRARAPSPALGGVADSELGVLRRQAELQTRHLPTRRLFERIPNLLRTLKPCLMMSPLSVATYLPPGAEPFDLVVFDEASQICPEDAVGALARGRQAIVAGDSKQLPPTKFFESRLAEGDQDPEAELVDLESVLQDGAATLPSHPLTWHYRSLDESLISFSNETFYDGALVTFPNAVRDPALLGLSFVHVPDGVYDPGRTRANRREAEVVADRVFALLSARPGDSLGVVTFSTTQRDAVLDAIDARRRADESFEPRFADDQPEPVFVKNLEAVQGDERDVILFSVGYGRDAAGAFLHHFGPLNLDGGERRLNVAVSRARKQMIVVASILPSDIDPERVTKPGARLLRAYLERAREGLRAPGDASGPDPETLAPLVRTVLGELTARGHRVEVHVGEAGFRIDLAVRHPTAPDRYLLGVLCDGPAGPGTLTVRDRERVRPEVLARLGWRIHRAWAPDWLRFPEREARRLEAAIAAALAEPAPTAAPPALPVPPPVPPVPPAPTTGSSPASPLRPATAGAAQTAIEGVVAYRAARLVPQGDAAAFHDGPLAAVAAALARVVEAEAPVHVEEAARRVAAAWGLQRLTPRVLARVTEAAARLATERAVERRGAFLHVPGGAAPPVRRPADGVERALEQVAPEELEEAMVLVVAACLGLGEEALLRQTAAIFGLTRLGEAPAERLGACRAALLARGRLVRDDAGWLRLPHRP